MIKLGTVFSGIGAIEQALLRLSMDHEIEFACDNGDVEISVDTDKELDLIRVLSSPAEKRDYVDTLYKKNSIKTNFVKQSYLANYHVQNGLFFVDVKRRKKSIKRKSNTMSNVHKAYFMCINSNLA